MIVRPCAGMPASWDGPARTGAWPRCVTAGCSLPAAWCCAILRSRSTRPLQKGSSWLLAWMCWNAFLSAAIRMRTAACGALPGWRNSWPRGASRTREEGARQDRGGLAVRYADDGDARIRRCRRLVYARTKARAIRWRRAGTGRPPQCARGWPVRMDGEDAGMPQPSRISMAPPMTMRMARMRGGESRSCRKMTARSMPKITEVSRRAATRAMGARVMAQRAMP